MYRRTQHGAHRRAGARSPGFSLLELTIVVAIILIVTAIAIPAVKRTVASYQLTASGTEVAGMLESARLSAVKTNQPYYAVYNNAACPSLVCAAPATGNYTSDDPTVAISRQVVFPQIANAPNHDQLDSYLGGVPGIFPELGTPIGFNARGLPCIASAGSPFVCQQSDPNPANVGIPAFEWFMQSSMTQEWVAITVSPAGRIRSWRLVSSGGKKTNCGFAACWQ